MRHRVVRHSLERWCDPEVVFRALYADQKYAFWLDSGATATVGRSYLGEGSRLVTADVAQGTVTQHNVDAMPQTERGDIFDFLASQQLGVEPDAEGCVAEGFQLGWVGWIGYEQAAVTIGESAPSRGRRSRHPDAAWLGVERAIEFDHALRTVTLVALGDGWSEELAAWRDTVLSALSSVGARRSMPPPLPAAVQPEARWRYTDEAYLTMIGQCQEAIERGNAYQLCLTTEVEVEVACDPVQVYCELRAMSPSHHGGFVRVGEVSLLSSSPEVFLTVSADGVIEARPIKGTRRRGTNAFEDEALRVELRASQKERAENLMIVDLMRNDLSKVSAVGTVSVPELLEVESYAQVHQLVSTVRGQLARGRHSMDAVTACFPAGSMTGAPKLSAMRILDSLEARARGVYSGAFGYVGGDGRIELAMVIRSIVLDAQGALIGTGGGITALSVPKDELDEVKLKAAALLRVLGVTAGRAVSDSHSAH